MAYFEMPDGATIYYEVYGEGLPVVFLHAGLGFDSSYLKNAFLPLADSGKLKLVFFDFRGNGKSSRRQTDLEFTVEQLVEDTDNLRVALGFGKIILLGHSFGGVVAQDYAWRFPENIRGLILDGSYPEFGAEVFAALERRASPDEMKIFVEAFGSFAPDDETFARAAESVLPLYFYEFDERKASAFLREMTFSAAAFNRSAELLPGVNLTEKLPRVKAPTLIVAGRHDLYGLAQTGERMHKKILNSRLVVFGQSGHFSFLEETEKYLRTIADFASNLSG